MYVIFVSVVCAMDKFVCVGVFLCLYLCVDFRRLLQTGLGEALV